MDKNFVIGFIMGAGLGALTAYFAVKNRFQQQADDQIQEMRDYVRDRLHSAESPSETPEKETNTSTHKGFRRVSGASSDSQEAQNEMKEEILKNHYNYASKSGEYSDDEGGETAMPKKAMIYAITGDEFDLGNENYDKASLTWYPKQEILTDEDDHRISTECIGGDDMLVDGFEDDIKHVRNDALDTDYEIVIDDVNTWVNPEE